MRKNANLYKSFLAILSYGVLIYLLFLFVSGDAIMSLVYFLISIFSVFLFGFKYISEEFGKLFAKSFITLFDKFEDEYLNYIDDKHRDFDTFGLTVQGEFDLNLQEVYVELKLNQEKFDENDLKSIWEYLPTTQKGKAKGEKLVIIGAPGSGKSTLLKHMALRLANRDKSTSCKHIPILLFLRDVEEVLRTDGKSSLSEVIMKVSGDRIKDAPNGWFNSNLKKGKCLVMFDGLDEIADVGMRSKVVNWVQSQLTEHPKNCFVITSRPHGYENNPLSGVKKLSIRPFNQDQIRKFIHNWYLANGVMRKGKMDAGVRMKAEEQANDLIKRLNLKPALATLAINPLLITMIATIHSFKGILPGRRVDLYHDIFDVFLRRRQEYWRSKQLEPAQVFEVLKLLGYTMMRKEIREIEEINAIDIISKELSKTGTSLQGEGFLKSVYQQGGFLVEVENGRYAFAHLTFQEYLASAHIIDDRSNELQQKIVQRIGESWWIETTRLYAAQTDATQIIKECLHKATTSPSALGLALDCVTEGLKIDPKIRTELNTIVNQSIESSSPEERRIAAEAKLASRIKKGWMVPIDERKSIDNNLITNVEYQLFLDEMREKGVHYYPDHWVEHKFPSGEGKNAVQGIRALDAKSFCEWLTKREILYANYRLASDIEASINETGLFGYYWCETAGKITLRPNNPIISLPQIVVTAQLEKDIEVLIKLRDAIEFNEKLEKQRPTTEVILGRLIDVFSGGGSSKADVDRSIAINKQFEYEFEVKMLYKNYNRVSDALGLDYRNVIDMPVLVFLGDRESRAKYSSWLSARLTYFREFFDLGDVYANAKKALNDLQLTQLSLIQNNLIKAIDVLETRSWASVETEKMLGWQVYSFTRWYARVCASTLGYLTHAKPEQAIVYEDIVVDFSILEERIRRNKQIPIFGGIRLLKQDT